jgi:hypothetical protein
MMAEKEEDGAHIIIPNRTRSRSFLQPGYRDAAVSSPLLVWEVCIVLRCMRFLLYQEQEISLDCGAAVGLSHDALCLVTGDLED